jgi:hypothetical protein
MAYWPQFNTKKERAAVIPAAAERILQQEDGKKRFMSADSKLSQTFGQLKSCPRGNSK